MNKISVRPNTMMAPLPSVMVSCGSMEKSNIITVAWTGVVNSDPPYVYISVRPSRYSHDIIENSGEFVINLVPKKLSSAMDLAGCTTGARIDKFEKLKLTKLAGDVVAAPLIEECPVNFECRIFQTVKLPSHDMFLAEIVAIHADENLVSEKGRIDLAKAELVSLIHGEYYSMTKYAGKMGFSVRKKKPSAR